MIKHVFAAALMLAAFTTSVAANDTVHSGTTLEPVVLSQFLDNNNDGVLIMSLERFRELNPAFAGFSLTDVIPADTEIKFVVDPVRA